MLRVLLALVAVATLVSAAHSPLGRCELGPVGIVHVTTKAGTFYLEDRSTLMDDPLANVWEETNGIWVPNDDAHSLQRGGFCSFHGECWGEWCVDDPLVMPDLSVLF